MVLFQNSCDSESGVSGCIVGFDSTTGQPTCSGPPGYDFYGFLHDQQNGNNAYDVAYNARGNRVTWSGNPTQSNWQEGNQTLNYVVSDGDFYSVSDQIEHWYEPSRTFQSVTLTATPTGGGQTTTLATNTTQAAGTLTVPENNLPSGTYTLTLTATVDGGQTLSITNPNFRVDHTPPTGTLDPIPAATNTTINATGTIADGQSGPATWTFQYQGTNNGASGTCVATPATANATTGKWGCAWSTNQSPEGNYTTQVAMADSVGAAYGGPNTANATPQGNTSVIVDRTPPTASLSCPGSGSWSNAASVTCTVTGSDPANASNGTPGSGLQTLEYQTQFNNGSWSGWTSVSTGATFTIGQEGITNIQAQAIDNAGNTYTTPTTTVELDHTPPTISEITPAEGSDFAGEIDSNPQLVIMTQQDNLSGVKQTTLDYNTDPNGGENLNGWKSANAAPATGSGDSATMWDTSEIPDGNHRVRATACDNAGNCAQYKYNVAMTANRRTCDQGVASHCYAGVWIGQPQCFGSAGCLNGGAYGGGLGIDAILETPNGVPKGSGFTGMFIAGLGGSKNANPLETGYINNDSGCSQGTQGWHVYADVNSALTFPCYGQIGINTARCFAVVLRGNRGVALIAPDSSSPCHYRARAETRQLRSSYFGKGYGDLTATGETDTYGRNVAGFFFRVGYLTSSGWHAPVSSNSWQSRDGPQGYKSELYQGNPAAFCVHGPYNHCTSRANP
jgi:hypothetical protein